MKIENDNIVLNKSGVAFSLHYELQQIADYARDGPDNRLAYHQDILEGMLSILDLVLTPTDYNIIMRPVREIPGRENIATAFHRIVKVFGESDMSLKEVLGDGV